MHLPALEVYKNQSPIFWTEGPTVSQKSLALGSTRLALVNPILRQCNQPFASMSAKTFCALSEALWGR